MLLQYQINIHGKVYKTGIRYFLKQYASKRKIKGCVFYLEDHTLGVIVTGKKPELDDFIKYCKSGNMDSVIESIIVKKTPLHNFTTFEVIDDKEYSYK